MQRSAGLLLFRHSASGIEVLLAHPGGPFYARRDEGVWSVPKGLLEPDDADEEAAARREFEEETGWAPPAGVTVDLGWVTQKGGKRVRAFALEGDWDPAELHSNTFTLEWPPRSGRRRAFPEIDRAAWFGLPEAAAKVLPAQRDFLLRLAEHVGADRD